MRLAGIEYTPLKGARVVSVDSIELDTSGLRDDRRYVLIDDQGRQRMAQTLPNLSAVIVERQDGGLVARFPDDSVVEDPAEPGDDVDTFDWQNTPRPGRVVDGPLAEALSAYAGMPLRIADLDGHGIGGSDVEPVTLLGHGSVEHLAGRMGLPELDHRRFRCNLILDDDTAHAEDDLVGSSVQIGEAQLDITGQIPRCVVVTRDPLTGRRDADVLRAIEQYRGSRIIPDGRRKVFFGVYARVATPGTVRAGDPVTPR
jgi:uncharacterized protein